MPFALLFFGLLLLVAGVRGTHKDSANNPGLFTLLKGDFWGEGSYTFFIVAIMAVGALGYVEPMRVPSRYLLALILIVLILSQEKRGGGGFFVKFKQALDSAVTRTAVEPRGTQTIIPPNSTVRKSDIGGGFSLPTIGDLENALNGAR